MHESSIEAPIPPPRRKSQMIGWATAEITRDFSRWNTLNSRSHIPYRPSISDVPLTLLPVRRCGVLHDLPGPPFPSAFLRLSNRPSGETDENVFQCRTSYLDGADLAAPGRLDAARAVRGRPLDGEPRRA